MAELKEYLKKLGVDITKIEDKDADLDTLVTEFNNSQKTHYETILKNEGWKAKTDFDEEVKKYDGKLNGQLNHELKKLGLPLAEIETLTVKEKFTKLKEFQDTQAGTADKAGKEEVLKLQQEKIDLQNQVNEFPAKLEAAKTEAQTEYNNRMKADKISLKTKETFVGVPKERVIGNQHSDGMFKAVTATISATYDADLSDAGELIYYNKGSQTRPTTKIDGKEVIMTASDILTSTLKELNFYVESNGKGNGGQQQQQNNGQQQTQTKRPIPQEMLDRQKEMQNQAQ